MSQCFFFSTGRCGTQWLAAQFGRHYGDLLDVEHEPDAYAAFKDSVPAEGNSWLIDTADDEVFCSHLEGIAERSEVKGYLESGFPAWKAIPAVAERFPQSLKIVHLTRHPVTTAYSWMSKGAYVPPMLPHETIREMITPFMDGVRFPEYRKRWQELSAYEKNLYNWLELHASALAFEAVSAVSWLRMKYEELFTHEGLERLIDFLELPVRQAILDAQQQQVDAYRYYPRQIDNPALIREHPDICALADRLGYRIDDVDMDALGQRFFPYLDQS